MKLKNHTELNQFLGTFKRKYAVVFDSVHL